MAKLEHMQGLLKELNSTFFQTLEDIRNKKDFETFFNDFLTKEELKKYIKRLGIAYWLRKGRTMENIKNNLRVTSKEIKFIKDQLETKGIKLALKNMEAEEWANVWSKKIKNIL